MGECKLHRPTCQFRSTEPTSCDEVVGVVEVTVDGHGRIMKRVRGTRCEACGSGENMRRPH
ncbi:unnamed protein product [Sphenostylis stenocarpa]|uniref:Uncharacterized protein n=1 Tax=Sphenostylis stenocarpa TaxID=92480 RepID=A0AA86SV31_9FABA|nr:unnamed protein product [Sphenostylis stenocarpa]